MTHSIHQWHDLKLIQNIRDRDASLLAVKNLWNDGSHNENSKKTFQFDEQKFRWFHGRLVQYHLNHFKVKDILIFNILPFQILDIHQFDVKKLKRLENYDFKVKNLHTCPFFSFFVDQNILPTFLFFS